MYNWCLNKVKITGKEENLKKISQIINKILDENDELVLMESLIGKDSINAEDYYNDVRWHDAEIKYWGVKWDIKYGDCISIDKNEYILLEFQTVWHPKKFSQILSKKYENQFFNFVNYKMKSMKNFGVFCGGFSSEFVISIKSAETIIKNFPKEYRIFKIIISQKGWEVETNNSTSTFDLNTCSFEFHWFYPFKFSYDGGIC